MRLVVLRLNLSARVFDRILTVARTIADLRGAADVLKSHLSEAVQYRDRTGAQSHHHRRPERGRKDHVRS